MAGGWPGPGLTVRSPQGTAGLTRTAGTSGPGTGRSGCWGRGWTGTKRSCSGEGSSEWGPGASGSPTPRAMGVTQWTQPLESWW